jgi:hypothetical protein
MKRHAYDKQSEPTTRLCTMMKTGFNQNGPLQLDAITGRYCSASQ